MIVGAIFGVEPRVFSRPRSIDAIFIRLLWTIPVVLRVFSPQPKYNLTQGNFTAETRAGQSGLNCEVVLILE